MSAQKLGTHEGGANIYGVGIGILSLDSSFAKPPGHVKNALTFGFPVSYKVVEGATVKKLLRDPGPDLLEPFLRGVRELERDGVRAVTGSCGFLALYQRELADAVDIPVFMSSLVQLPLVQSQLKRGQKVGVLTASKASLTPAYLEAVGAGTVPVCIEGMDGSEEFDSVIIEAERNRIDFDKLEAEIVSAAERLAGANPDMGALVLECTDMSPFADAIQRRLKMPVFDLVTLTEMVYAAVTRARHPLFAPASRWS